MQKGEQVAFGSQEDPTAHCLGITELYEQLAQSFSSLTEAENPVGCLLIIKLLGLDPRRLIQDLWNKRPGSHVLKQTIHLHHGLNHSPYPPEFIC